MKASVDQIIVAATEYCRQNPGCQCSHDTEKNQVRIMLSGIPSETDIFVWSEDGNLRCSNPEFGMEFAEYIKSESRAVVVPTDSTPPATSKGGIVDEWRTSQEKTYSVAGKKAPNAFAVSEEANRRGLCTQIIDSGRDKDLVWAHVRIVDPRTGQYREDRVAHERSTFCLLKAWEDANSQARYQKGLIVGIADDNMPILNPDIRIKNMPAPLWLTMQIMRAWSFADRDALTKAERRAQLKMLNREWREDDEIILEQEEEKAVRGA